MNTLLKKALGILLAVITAISLFAVSVNAATPLIYQFGSYTGNETVSVDLQGDYTKFVRLEDENSEINSQNYTVSGDEQKTTLTLKEEYLNGLKNGEHNFKGYFENVLNTYEFSAFEDSAVLIPATQDGEFVNLTANETEVEKSNYDVEKTSDGFVITFKEEFLQTLPENTGFCAYYNDSSMCYIKLQVKKPSTEPSTEPNTNPTLAPKATKPAQPSNGSQNLDFPKTGVNNHMPELISVILISAGILSLGILHGFRKKAAQFRIK